MNKHVKKVADFYPQILRALNMRIVNAYFCAFTVSDVGVRYVRIPPLFDLFVFQTPYQPAAGLVGRSRKDSD